MFFFLNFFQMCTNGPCFEISFSNLGFGVCKSLRVDLKLVASCPCSMGRPLCLTVCLLSWAGTMHCTVYAEKRAKSHCYCISNEGAKGSYGGQGVNISFSHYKVAPTL